MFSAQAADLTTMIEDPLLRLVDSRRGAALDISRGFSRSCYDRIVTPSIGRNDVDSGRRGERLMQVLTNTDRSVAGSAALSAQVEASVRDVLGRFSHQVTRVEVHLSDENAQKGGADDKRCLIEARLQGRPPTAVSHRASTMRLAIDGAAAKLARALESTIARLRSS
jgi:ribosome-associated translation inhibitor RaiA